MAKKSPSAGFVQALITIPYVVTNPALPVQVLLAVYPLAYHPYSTTVPILPKPTPSDHTPEQICSFLPARHRRVAQSLSPSVAHFSHATLSEPSRLSSTNPPACLLLPCFTSQSCAAFQTNPNHDHHDHHQHHHQQFSSASHQHL